MSSSPCSSQFRLLTTFSSSIIKHPRILPCLGARWVANEVWILTELADSDLYKYLTTRPSGAHRLRIGQQVAEGMMHLHSLNYMHRGTFLPPFLLIPFLPVLPNLFILLILLVLFYRLEEFERFSLSKRRWSRRKVSRFWYLSNYRFHNDFGGRDSKVDCSRGFRK